MQKDSPLKPNRKQSLLPSSDYIAAANRMRGKKARRRIVAYVEGYDDVLFWRNVLSNFEDETRYFEVMLPTRNSLNRGKKQALVSLIQNGVGENLLACVDADYDYLLQGSSPQSQFMLNNPYVLHTYVYAIENYYCYAPSLHNTCVMATLNDHRIFDFEEYLASYSRAIFPLFVWSIMLYRQGEWGKFTISDFNNVVSLRQIRLTKPTERQPIETEAIGQQPLDNLRHKVHFKISDLQRKHPGRKEEYLKTKESLLNLGVTPETTYLYVQGHHLFDAVVTPIMQTVCSLLRSEQEREIRSKAVHTVQMQNELSAYQHSQSDIPTMLRKSFGYQNSIPYKKLLADAEKALQ